MARLYTDDVAITHGDPWLRWNFRMEIIALS